MSDSDSKGGKGGWSQPFSAIFNNAKMGEVAWTSVAIGGLLLLFVLLYSVAIGIWKIDVLSKSELNFCWGGAIFMLFYAFLYTSIKDLYLGSKSSE